MRLSDRQISILPGSRAALIATLTIAHRDPNVSSGSEVRATAEKSPNRLIQRLELGFGIGDLVPVVGFWQLRERKQSLDPPVSMLLPDHTQQQAIDMSHHSEAILQREIRFLLLKPRRQEFVFLLGGKDVAGQDPRRCCGAVTIHPLPREAAEGPVANVFLVDRRSPGESVFGI